MAKKKKKKVVKKTRVAVRVTKKVAKKTSKKKKVELPTNIKYKPDDSDQEFTIVRELFTVESPKHLGHLKLHDGSGMGSWLRAAGTKERTWTGIPPVECTVAYNREGKAIGWCAVGDFTQGLSLTSPFYGKKVDVIGTYVMPDYRLHGIGVQLLKMTLAHCDSKRTIAYDDAGWDISPMLKKAKLKHVPFHTVW